MAGILAVTASYLQNSDTASLGDIKVTGQISGSGDLVLGELDNGSYISASSEGSIEISGSGLGELTVEGNLSSSQGLFVGNYNAGATPFISMSNGVISSSNFLYISASESTHGTDNWVAMYNTGSGRVYYTASSAIGGGGGGGLGAVVDDDTPELGGELATHLLAISGSGNIFAGTASFGIPPSATQLTASNTILTAHGDVSMSADLGVGGDILVGGEVDMGGVFASLVGGEVGTIDYIGLKCYQVAYIQKKVASANITEHRWGNAGSGFTSADKHQYGFFASGSQTITDESPAFMIYNNSNVGIGTKMKASGSADPAIARELPRLTVSGSISASGNFITQGHITASGNISASGYISGSSIVTDGIITDGDDAIVSRDLQVNRIVNVDSIHQKTTGLGVHVLHNITSSANISSSGKLEVGSNSGEDTVFQVSHRETGSLMKVQASNDSGSIHLSGSLKLHNNPLRPSISGSKLYNFDGNIETNGIPIGPVQYEMVKGAMNDDIGTTEIYLPFNNNFENTFVSDEMGIVAPCSGSAKTLTVRAASLSGDITYTIRVRKMVPGATSTTIIDTQTIDLVNANDNDTFTITFDEVANFAPGNTVFFTIQGDADRAGSVNYYFATVIAWDYSTLPTANTIYTQ